MATVINNPTDGDSGGGMGFLLGAILLIVFVIALIYYGLPALRGSANTGPSGGGKTSSEVNVDVPDKVDVNINGGQQ